ncbi:MAG: arsenate reductase family protein [Bacteroidaceae bacterium]|nr:arsenate reductase family protein [Bacteroidaceae bacterium]
MLLLHYPKCSTCRKALKWAEANGLQPTLRHIVDERPTAEELAQWIDRSGLPVQKFFNTSGVVYKERGLKDVVKTASRDALIALLAEDGKLVKRPLMITPERVLVGFNEADWATLL